MSERKRKYFGRDGIRGLVGRGLITPEFVMKLGWALGCVLAKNGKSSVLIGKDTRISGYMFESALEAGLSAAGVDIILVGPMPTPAIAFLAKTFRADAGIVISASHNAFYDNGIKIFDANGERFHGDIIFDIEDKIDEPCIDTVDCEALGKAHRIDDAAGRYVEFCKSTCQYLDLSDLHIVLDCAHGACYDVGPKVFEELGAKVTAIGVSPDGLNINNEFGTIEPANLQAKVLKEQADIGIAFDGDGDRVVMVDHKGELVDGDEILFIIARHLKESGQYQGGVVGTVVSNLGFEKALDRINIPFVRAKVGDRYVNQALKENGWWLGGETCGHVVNKSISTTGDGIVAALQVLLAIKNTGALLNTAKSGMRKYPQAAINVSLPKPYQSITQDEFNTMQADAEQKLSGSARVLLRASGTEPVIRVTVEGEDSQQVIDVCRQLGEKIERLIKS